MEKIMEFLKKIGLLKVKSETYSGENQTADPTTDM